VDAREVRGGDGHGRARPDLPGSSPRGADARHEDPSPRHRAGGEDGYRHCGDARPPTGLSSTPLPGVALGRQGGRPAMACERCGGHQFHNRRNGRNSLVATNKLRQAVQGVPRHVQTTSAADAPRWSTMLASADARSGSQREMLDHQAAHPHHPLGAAAPHSDTARAQASPGSASSLRRCAAAAALNDRIGDRRDGANSDTPEATTRGLHGPPDLRQPRPGTPRGVPRCGRARGARVGLRCTRTRSTPPRAEMPDPPRWRVRGARL
jgi:hypothetical protein